MTFGERLLLRFSKPVATVRAEHPSPWSVATALELLDRVYPGFQQAIRGRDVVDFGCGRGYQTVAMAEAGARSVLGLDIVPNCLADAQLLAEKHGVQERVEFRSEPPADTHFDVVVSQNSMEHFPEPLFALRQMAAILRANGMIFVTFGPPWLAPFGHHCHYFAPIPWLNLLFRERVVMNVRARYVHDGATRYEDVTGGLNRMTVRKFEQLVHRARLTVEQEGYDVVKKLPSSVTRVPILRELLINRVSVVLRPAAYLGQ